MRARPAVGLGRLAMALPARGPIAVLLVLVAVAGCGSAGSESSDWGADPLSVQRPGYPANGPAMGDPAALVSEPGTPEPIRYQGSPVVQACDLLTPEDLTSAGFLLVPATATGLVERTYLDGHGNTDLPLPTAGVVGTVAGEVNSCHYVVGIEPNTASVTVVVYQPSYVARDNLDRTLNYDYRKSGDVGPVEVFQPRRPAGEYARPWLRHRDVWIQLTLGPFPEPVTTRLVDAIARVVPAVVANPGGPRRFTYRSPIFSADYLNACQISAADDFRAIFGVEPSPSVEEGIAPSIGRIEFTNVDGVTANYVSHRCERHTTAQFDEASALIIETKTYDTPDAARADLLFIRAIGNATDTPTRLGDESIIATVFGQRELVVRTGLAVVDISLYDGPGRLNQPLDAALLTAATAVAKRAAP